MSESRRRSIHPVLGPRMVECIGGTNGGLSGWDQQPYMDGYKVYESSRSKTGGHIIVKPSHPGIPPTSDGPVKNKASAVPFPPARLVFGIHAYPSNPTYNPTRATPDPHQKLTKTEF